MTLVRAATLGIDRFARDGERESWSVASGEDRNATLHAVYRQVLGGQHLLRSERLEGAESLFRNGDLTVREFVRAVARSALYRERFFETCNPYRFIELNHKHLLGRAPQNREEMLHHFTILQEQGYEAEIDSYIDSGEYARRFGENVVPYMHGWDYSVGHQGRQFSWMMQLARGAAASAKGDRTGNQAALNRPLHQNRAVPVPVVISVPVPRGPISTDGPFRAQVSSESGLYGGEPSQAVRAPHSRDCRGQALGIAAGEAGTSGRLVTLQATGLVRNRYCRSGETTLRIPFSRMNEALRRLHRLGARTLAVNVSGQDPIGSSPNG